MLFPKDLTHLRISSMWKRGRGLKTQYEWRKNITFSIQELAEKKNTLKHFELNVDRDGIKGGGKL